MSFSLIRKAVETRKLPPGHYDAQIAQQKLKNHYAQCKQVEQKWDKRFKIKELNTQDALIHCNQICNQLGQKLIKKIVIESPDVEEGVAAHYTKNEIHFKYQWISITTLIHELTHHFDCNLHDDKFCNVENFLFRVSYQLLHNKKPKEDW